MKVYIILNGKGEDEGGGFYRTSEQAYTHASEHNKSVENRGGGDYDDYWHVKQIEVTQDDIDEEGFYSEQ